MKAEAHENRILDHLLFLYGTSAGPDVYRRLQEIMDQAAPRVPRSDQTVLGGGLSERDAILITYPDQLREAGVPPLQTLAEFCEAHLRDTLTGVHILPFFPSSSDDGFSVVDYRRVDPALGSWDDVARLGRHFALMFDAVINHVSAQSAWFQGFLQEDPGFRDYFIVVEGDPDLSQPPWAQVVRPRALPLLNTFATATGPKAVWTTFSRDQVDLNYRNPQVLLEVIDTLLFYVAKGAELIRLDAVAFLWKEIGTPCIHLPETHRIIQLMRAVLDGVAPYAFLITETNVPHDENVAYFGKGDDEAQMVYNFALPPLVLHTLLTGEAHALRRWAAGLETPSDRTTYFNFLASHDGIGLNPVRGILRPEQIEHLVEAVQARGGLVSYKNNPDGTQSPYELNISYFDALSDPGGGEPLDRQVERFLAAHAILCSLKGVPGIYFHSLSGSRSWFEGAARSGQNRTINRQKLNRVDLEQELALPGSLRAKVFEGISDLLRVRGRYPAFHPNGSQQILGPGLDSDSDPESNPEVGLGPGVFACWRWSPDGAENVLCAQNVCDRPQPFRLPGTARFRVDLLSGREVGPGADGAMILEPYQSVWLMEGESE